MPETPPGMIASSDVAPNRRRGGDIRVLLSPKTVGSTSGFMGVLTLLPGEHVAEHYHPYSEEFLYVVQGSLHARLDGEREITIGAAEGMMISKGVRHRISNLGSEASLAVFHLSPLAPRPELGHVDTEPLPSPAERAPEVGGAR